MPDRIDPIVINVEYSYNDSNLEKARQDLNGFERTAINKIGSAKKTFEGLKETYSSLKSSLSKDNEQIKKSMSLVESSIKNAENAYLEYSKKRRSSSQAAKNYKSLVEEYTSKGMSIDKQKNVFSVSESGEIEKNEAATRRLTTAYTQNKNAKDSQKQALSRYQAAINSVYSEEEKLISKQEQLNNSINNTNLASTTAKNSINTFKTSLQNLKKAVSGIRFISLLAYLSVFKRIAKAAVSFVEASSDWIENLNLLEVVFNDTADAAKEFIDVTANNFGLDKNALAQYVSTFKQMANAMGQASETGTQLSEVLTLIALDVASLRNVDVATAVSDFTSALAGQVKPVRKYGFDITMYSIDELMEELGLASYSRTMSQANKQLARAILLVRQSSDAWGDMAKTINTFANQQRILNDQFETTKRLLGNVFMGTIDMGDSFEEAKEKAGIATKAIWYLNGALLAVNEILKVFVPETTSIGVTSIAAGAEDAADAIDDLTESTDSSLASFDKFNTMSSGAGELESSVVSEALSSLLNQEYEKYMAAYEERLKNINMYAKQIAQTFLQIAFPQFGEWLKEEGNAGKEFSDFIEETGTTAAELKSNITDLAKDILGFVGAITFLVKPLAAIASYLAVLFVQNEDFRKSIVQVAQSISDMFLNLGESFANLLIQLTPLINFVTKIISAFLIMNNNLGTTTILFYGLIAAIIAFKSINLVTNIIQIVTSIKQLNITLNTTKILVTTGILAIILLLSDLIINWDNLTAAGKTFRIILIAIITAFVALKAIKPSEFFSELVNVLSMGTITAKQFLTNILGIAAGIASLTLGIVTFVQGFDQMSKTAQILIPIIAALAAVLAGLAVARAAAAAGLAAPVMAGVTAAALVAGMVLVSGTALAMAHAEGGYQTGGLFYAGEDGAEWVGRQGRTSTIVNDKQMSDIMMEAVAEGVVVGNSANNNKKTSREPIVLQVNGKEFLRIVEDEGKKVGKTLARA